MDKFDPQKHICKFSFELRDYISKNPYTYNIIGDLYLRELKFEFINKITNDVIDTVGIKISTGRIGEILPFLVWEDYEKFREFPREFPPPWDLYVNNGFVGYRDGWCYRFRCLSESGMPLITIDMYWLFDKKMLPPYERLLDWIKRNYKKNKQLKDKYMFW